MKASDILMSFRIFVANVFRTVVGPIVDYDDFEVLARHGLPDQRIQTRPEVLPGVIDGNNNAQ